MHSIRRHLLAAVGAALALGAAPGSAQTRETLGEVLAYALETHPRVGSAAALARGSRGELALAESLRSPRVSAYADPGRSYHRADGAVGTPGDVALRSSVLIFDFSRTDNEIERQRSRLVAAAERIEAAAAQLVFQVTEHYVEVVKQEELEAVASTNVTVHESLQSTVQTLAVRDESKLADVALVGSRLQHARMTNAARRDALEEARAVLTALVGRPVSAVVRPADPVSAMPATREAALDQLDSHPAVRAARADIDAARKAADIASSFYRPRVDVVGSVGSPVVNGDRQYLGGYDLRLVLEWPLLDGGGGSAAARIAAEQTNAALENAGLVRRDLGVPVARFWSQVEARRGRIAGLDELASRTDSVRTAYWDQFMQGRRSTIELLNAQSEWFHARFNAENERLELLQAQYRLLAAMGRLLPWLGVKTPESMRVSAHGAR
jgi:adhesin transport system outer membrane protein